ncbi:MAG: alpha-L-glutamate ligase-like protein [Gammaproteobacteria bacterium]|nr:alpha-L-glutamate ligase-like protein [Gammaproteobacteria bacterium]
MLRSPRQLRELGVLGMNERNANFVQRFNERRLYPLVDDKLQTKRLALAAGIAVPELYGVMETPGDTARLAELVANRDEFVIKPAHGSGGDGIMVVSGQSARRRGQYRLMDGSFISEAGIRYHATNIISGRYSLGGHRDQAMIEYCVQPDPVFAEATYRGVPDIRVLVFRGYPAMAMVRLPTRQSHGKANLHQGAIGAGIDLLSGRTVNGVFQNQPTDEHPDTGAPVVDIQVPHWNMLLELAARCYDLTELGYLGVDLVLDRDHGPLILELNARPGLSIQIANRAGLRRRFGLFVEQPDKRPVADRLAYMRAALHDEPSLSPVA